MTEQDKYKIYEIIQKVKADCLKMGTNRGVDWAYGAYLVWKRIADMPTKRGKKT